MSVILDAPSRQPIWSSFDGEGMTGAEVFASLCKNEGLAALFCAPGNYSITHAMAASGIPSFGGRTEGGMCSAADGFYRASGEVAAASGTEGEDKALEQFRRALEPEWSSRDAIARSCRGSAVDERALDAIERLRYAEEHAVRREAVLAVKDDA